MVVAGDTTIWERWDALRTDGTVNTADLTDETKESNGGMVSFNHYAAGAVGDWFYRRIAGIEAVEGGYRRFRVAPIIGGGLTFARGSVETPYGRASSAWAIAGNQTVASTMSGAAFTSSRWNASSIRSQLSTRDALGGLTEHLAAHARREIQSRVAASTGLFGTQDVP